MVTGAARTAQTRRLRRVVDAALTAYDVRAVRVRRLPRGWNATFGVQAEDRSRYALRVHRPDGPDAAMVRSELSWLRAIAEDTDLVVPRPHPTRDGGLLTVVDDPAVVDDEGPRVCDLLGWVDGHFVGRERLRPAHLDAMGRLSASLQQHGRGFARPAGFSRRDVLAWTDHAARGQDVLDPDVARLAGDALHALDPAWDAGVVRVTAERARAARDSARRSGRLGLLHADLHHENVLFSPGGRGRGPVAAAIDFDDCGDGPDAYDLAVTLSEVPRTDDLREALLAGYERVRALPGSQRAGMEEEVQALTGFRFLQLATYVAEHHDEPTFGADWREDVGWLPGRAEDLARRS